MRNRRLIHAVDSHTEGMPTRVVTGGVATIPGSSMLERRDWAKRHLDDVRGLLMLEPRGHSAMSGVVLQPPTRPDADWGVLYMEPTGYLSMCGHATIGVATVLAETGMVTVKEPVTTIRLDTPAGLVEARVSVSAGRARSVTLTNVPSFVVALDQTVDVPGLGMVRYDMAYGGNFYPIVEAASLGLSLDRCRKSQLIDAAVRIAAAVNDQSMPVHPSNSEIRSAHSVLFTDSQGGGPLGRNAVVTTPGYFDRSPCGTGTSARMALLHAVGQLDLGESFVSESLLGTHFTGRLIATADVHGVPAVIPTITGRAWITGFGQYLLDPDDPFPAGFTL